MTKIVERKDIHIQSFETNFNLAGTTSKYTEQYDDVKSFEIVHGVLQFAIESPNQSLFIATNRPFSVSVTRSLSCGHKLKSYRCDRRNGVPENERCIECDAMPPAPKFIEGGPKGKS